MSENNAMDLEAIRSIIDAIIKLAMMLDVGDLRALRNEFGLNDAVGPIFQPTFWRDHQQALETALRGVDAVLRLRMDLEAMKARLGEQAVPCLLASPSATPRQASL